MYYQEFLAQQGSDLNVRAEAAAAYERVGKIQLELGRFKDALAAYDRGLALVPASSEDPAWAAARLRIQQGQIAALSSLRRFDEGILKFEGAVAPYRDAISAATDARNDIRPILVKLYNTGAEIYANSGRMSESLKASRRALEIGEGYARDWPAEPGTLHDLLFAYTFLTRELIVAGDPDEALVVGLHGLERGKAMVRENPRDIDLPVVLADLHQNLATLEYPRGHQEIALAYNQESIALADRVSRENPLLFRPLDVLTSALAYRSNILSDLERTDLARQSAERAVEKVEEFLGRAPASFEARELLGNSLAALGKVHLKTKENGRAVATLRRAAGILESSGEAVYVYNAACCLSMASSIDDPALRTAADRQARRLQDANLAVSLLRKAIDHGLADLAMVRTDPDLNPIRQRSDFAELVREIETRAKSAVKPAPDAEKP